MKIEKGRYGYLLKISICFTLLLVIFLVTQGNFINNSVVLANSDAVYLSDIKYKSAKVGDKTLLLDKNMNGKSITVSIEGVDKFFLKGILAHAASEVIYDLSNYNYDYFTAYIGVDIASRDTNQGDGVKFKIYTSQNEEDWTEILNDNNTYKANTDARFVKLDIKGAKYLKLVAEAGKNNWSDHSVYANAKLIKEGYVEKEDKPLEFIKTVEEYNEIIKTHYGETVTGEYEHVLLKREFVKRVGYDILQAFAQLNNENEEMVSWLMNNPDNLRLYLLGGTPDGGSYYSSLNVLSRLYSNYKNDFAITERTKYGTVLGDLYKKMAITLSLTHSQRVALWMQPSVEENQSDAVTRYQIYKDMHKNGKFVVTPTIDITKWFEEYNIEEMRFVLNNIIDDEEILWINEYTQSYVDQYQNQAWKYLTPHPYMAYVYPNYGNPIFHDPEKKDYWDKKFNGIFSKYGVTYSTENKKIYKVWMNFRNEFGTGAVCGGISKTGSNIRTSHGIPAAVIGQPGHAAIIYYSQDDQGRGYWNLDNDVSGWTLSEKGERMLLGWGNASYCRGSYQVVYMALAQEVLNDYENFEKCEELVMLADVYKDDLAKQQKIYKDALKTQPINIDAWYGLINSYKTDKSKTENDFYELAQELAESLKYFPLPMYQLSNLIKTELTSIENSYKFTLLQTRILTEGANVPNNTADKYYVYQPSLTRVEANFLLGKLDKTIATFSFDGENAGKIVLASRFDGNGVRWDYSLDGKKNWKEVSFTADEEHKLTLTPEEISSITAENDIYVHIVGVNYDEENLYKIDILDSLGIPANLYANDWENKLIGAPNSLQWKFSENDEWISYSTEQPDLTGNKTIIVRAGATGVYLAGTTTETYQFTPNNDPDTRKYIPISNLSIHSVSSQATGQGRPATNAIDGNIKTNWHSDWNGGDREKYIIIKLKEAKYLSALEYFPAGGGNGKIKNAVISVSQDGENWTEVVSETNWPYNETKKSVDFEPTKAQYIKIVGKETQSASSSKSFMVVSMFNFYEDITKQPDISIKPEKYKIEEGYIYRILPETTLNVFKENIKIEQEFIVKTTDGNIVEPNDIIKTGMILEIGEKQYTLIVIGDVDCDGEITINDMAKIKLHFIDKEPLSGSCLKAADIDDDKEITMNDIAQIKLILINLLKLK